MGQIQRLTRGQVKPYNSIPRIDWSHPLANGLATYCYDIGGSFVDLVNGTRSTQVGCSGSHQSQFGRGLQFPLTGYAYMPPLPLSKLPALGSVAPFSAAMGVSFVGAPGAGSPDNACVTVQDSANTENTAFGFNTWPTTDPTTPNQFSCVLADATNGFPHTTVNPGHFQSLGCTAINTGTALLYSDGVVANTFTGATTISPSHITATPQIMFNTASINSGQTFGNGINGFVFYFGMWGRALSTADHLQLYQDPYCFLIYPEDEMSSTSVGTIGSVTTNLTVTVTSSGTVVVAKIAGRKVLVASSGSPLVQKAASKFISLVNGGAVSTIKSTVKAIAVSCSGAVSISKSIGKNIALTSFGGHGPPGSFQIVKAVGKNVAVVSSGAVSAVKAVARAVNLTTTGVMSAIKAVAKTFSLTAIGAVVISAIKGGANLFNVTVSAASTGAVSLLKSIGKNDAVASSGAVSVSRSIGKAVIVACTGAVTAAKAIARTIVESCVGAVTTASIKAKIIVVAITSSGAVSLLKSVAKKIPVTGSGAVSLVKSCGKLIANACSGTVSLIKSVVRAIALTSLGSVIVSAIKSGAGIFNVTVTVASSGAVSLQRAIARFVAVSSTGSPSFTKAIVRKLAIASTGSVSAIKTATKTVFVTCAGVVSSTAIKVRIVIVSIASSGAVSLRRATSKGVGIVSTGTVSAVKAITRLVTVSVTGATSFAKSVGKHVAAICSSVASALAHTGASIFNVTISIGVSSFTRLLARFVKKAGPESLPRTGRHDARPRSSEWPAAPREV